MADVSDTRKFDFNPLEQESNLDKLRRKMKADPFVPIGIMGGIGALGWGVYTYRSRGGMSTSIFLMRLRVVAQGMVVGAMSLGVGWTVVKRLMKSDKE